MLKKFRAQVFQSALIWSLAATLLRVGTLIFILPLIVRILPPEELGLWYVFLGVAGLTSLFDFGFSPTMGRITGYVWGGAGELQTEGVQIVPGGGGLAGPNYPLLIKLVSTMSFFYRLLAAVTLFLLLTGGSWWIWQKTQAMPHAWSLRGAWILFAVASGLNMTGNLWPVLLGGINGVKQGQQLFVISLLANYAVIISGLLCHLGLWALVLGQFFLGLILRLGGKYWFLNLSKIDPKSISSRPDRELFRTIWPMSCKNGLLGMSHFAIINANTLICSAYLGLRETASYGLSLQMVYFLTTLSVIGIQVKFPLINQLRAQNRLSEIARIFSSRMRWMFLIYGLGSLGILFFGQAMLLLIHAKTPFISPPIFVALLTFYFLEIHSEQYGGLIISENTMPTLVPTVITGVAVVLLSLILTPYLGLWGMVLSFGAASIAYVDWWIVWRGIRGLKMTSVDYWKLFFSFR